MAQECGSSIGALQYYLLPHISLCALDDGLIVLDQKFRRYYALPAQCRKALAIAGMEECDGHIQRFQVDAATPDVAATLAALTKKGVLTTDPTDGQPIRSPHVVASTSINFGWGTNEYAAQPKLRHVLLFVLALVRAAINLHLVRFDRLATRIRCRREQSQDITRSKSLDTVKILLVQFRRLRPLAYSSHGACLFDSLVLLEYLAFQSVYPMWVIGVDSRPFRAHSWVQYDGCVLNGTVENVQQFTPILVV